jgi:hypothetical protein
MPNHMHGIIIIERFGIVVETRLIASLQMQTPKTNANSWGGDVKRDVFDLRT